MNERDFLDAVVPWGTGYITLHWHRKGMHGFPGRSCQTVDEFLTSVQALESQEVDIYFCLSSQRENSGKRSRENASKLRAIWVDIDVDPNDANKYPSIVEATAALIHFCLLLEIPLPSAMVGSGSGLHGYWFSDHDLEVEEWQPFADALKAAALASTLKIDAGVTGDAARVLRPPSTQNYKYGAPRPVKLLQSYCNGMRHDFAHVFQKMLDNFPSSARPRPSAKIFNIADAFKKLDPNQKLAEGIEVKEIPPLPFAPIQAGCGWLRTAYETGGKEHDEPQWHLTTLCAVFLENGYELAHRFGDQHPDYTREETDGRWERKRRDQRERQLGWPSCRSISDHGGRPQCSQCPHFSKGRSPLNLAYETIKDNLADKEMLELGGIRPPELRLPEGFCVEKTTGRICAFFPTMMVKKKLTPGRLIWLISNRLREPTLQFQHGHYGLGFFSETDRGGEAEVFLSSVNVLRENIRNALAEKCVITNPEQETTSFIAKFGVSWLDKLRMEDEAVRDAGTMGWRYNKEGQLNGFVFGNKLYREDGTEHTLTTSTDDEFRSWYTPVGDPNVWVRCAKLLTDRKRPELDIIISIAFAAPLTVFAGTLYGAILSVWGEPGTSKSTAQQVAAAVWGHPKQTRESLNSTAKSVQGRLGRTKNLAAYWDDVQDERHQQALFDTMFVTAEGTEGGRLNPDASYKPRLEWQTLLVACSNASFIEYLTQKQKSTTAGIRRVFEFEFNKDMNEPGMINALAASKMFAELEHNYGGIGVAYAKMLAREHREINKLVADIMNDFTLKVCGVGDESFWWGTCGILLAGATLANRLGATIDIPAMKEFLIRAFVHNRNIRQIEGTEGGSELNTELALTGFLNEFGGSGHIMYTDKLFESRHTSIARLQEPLPGRQIYIQVARDQRTFLISKRALRKYLHDNHIAVRQVFRGLDKLFDAKEYKRSLGAGTTYAQTQEACLEFIVPATQHLFDEMLTAHGPQKGADDV